MIKPSEARGIVSLLDAGKLARATWRAAAPLRNGEVLSARNAAVALDLGSGELVLTVWIERQTVPGAEDPIVVLARCCSTDRERIAAALSEGLDVPPSQEVMEEQVARESEAEGISWASVEEQLSRIQRAAAG